MPRLSKRLNGPRTASPAVPKVPPKKVRLVPLTVAEIFGSNAPRLVSAKPRASKTCSRNTRTVGLLSTAAWMAPRRLRRNSGRPADGSGPGSAARARSHTPAARKRPSARRLDRNSLPIPGPIPFARPMRWPSPGTSGASHVSLEPAANSRLSGIMSPAAPSRFAASSSNWPFARTPLSLSSHTDVHDKTEKRGYHHEGEHG